MSPIALQAWRRVVVLLGWWLIAGCAFGQDTRQDFDHLRTGYALTGSHASQRCESCHLNGIFKGTPRECDACHTSGARFSRANIVKPSQHIPTTQACDTCHTTKTFIGAKFNHSAVMPGTCQTCHNGSVSQGKPADHLPTQAACDTCHRSTAWRPATGMDHSSFNAATNCASCHNGSTATGKSASHMPVGATNCISCHNVSPAGWKPTKWNHTQVSVAAQCSTCHSGSFPPADGKTATHIPYASVPAAATANCDTCHKSGYSSWSGGKLHASVTITSGCATCHSGAFPDAVGKPATPIHATATVCESCHTSTTSWSSAKVDHGTFNATTNCATCHNGSAATGKPATHIPVGSTNCISCHNVSPAGWKPTKWNHTQVAVTAQCSTCHTGGYPPADGKVSNHIPYASVPAAAAANCDTCHRSGYSTWTDGKLHAYISISSGCATCHSGAYLNAVGKPATAIHATATVCETCHTSTTSWTSAKVDHSTFNATTNCATCHNGSAATGKPATHIPVGATNCFGCHNVSPAAWKPTKWNHTQVTVAAQCSTCHTGGYPPADGKVANHIPYASVPAAAAANCDTCHKSGYASWTGGKLHAYVSVSTGCATCHTGAYLNAVGKPATTVHAGVTVCESCHKSTTSWTSVSFSHSAANAVGTGTCDTCHNGSTALGKPASHIPVPAGTAKCDSCHRSQTSFAASTTMNHAVVSTAACKTCHNGSYVSQGTQGALAKPANHIPESQLLNGASMDCSACHTSTTAWSTMTMNHNSSQGSGAGWCKACHTSGTTYLGSMERMSLTHRQKTPVPTDCSQSGCHRPLGTKGTPYRNWN